MAAEKMKCPMCGTKLKNVNGRMTCKDCGYYVREQNSSQTWQSQQTASSQASGSNQPSGQQKKSGGAGVKIAGACISFCVVIAVGVMISFAMSDLRALFEGLISSDAPAQSHRSEQPASSRDRAQEDIQESESPSHAKPAAGTKLPRSSFFQELASVIFGKSYDTITPEEYDSLTALEISKEDHHIYYLLRDQEEYQYLTFSNTIGMELSDLACFTGLEGIWLDDDLSWGDLDGLEHLQWIHVENNLSDLLKIIPNPENILSLSITDSIFELGGLQGQGTKPAQRQQGTVSR